ncbi:MAG: ABC transporter permease, partial [Longimicrobiales bacterium]
MPTILLDLRLAGRCLRRAPGFTAIAAVSIALGIGASVTIFGIVNAFFLRALPVASPDELVAVYARTEAQPWRNLSYPDVESLRAGARSLSGLTAFTVPGVRVSLRDEMAGPRAVPAAFVTQDYFDVLGLRPVRGRFFGAGDDSARGSSGVVIGERVWRDGYGADPSVIGREVWLNRQPFRVIGIAPARFTGTFANLATDVWLPLERYNDVLGGPDSVARRDSRFLNAIGRVRPGASREAVYA